MTEPSLELARPEDAHTRAEWERAAAAVLRKSGRLRDDDPDELVEELLTRTTLDGIAIPPLGLPGGAPPTVRPQRAGGWDIRAMVDHPDPARANEDALAELAGGATSLWVRADEATDLATVLAGVMLDLAPVVLEAPTGALAAGTAFLAAHAGRELHRDTNLGADPLGAMLRGLPIAPDEGEAELAGLAGLARGAGIRAIVVDATAAHDLGASDVQELGWSIAVGVAYLRMLTDRGLSVAEAADLIEFRYAATDRQFETIAKLRAARRLWCSVLEHSGAGGTVEQRQHAVSSRPMLSKYDAYVNMLRGTVAAFAAGVGGAEAVTVLPFDAANGRPEAFGRRIARNLSHLLIDESHVAVVADPAGGAHAVERLTADLATAGWAEFQTLEAEWERGEGLDGFRDRIAAVVDRREEQIARRQQPITGLSEFPNLGERLPEREPDPVADSVRRYGASFEALRDEPAARPVFLATLGPVAQHTARATFAANLLAAGGVPVEVAGASATPADLLASYQGQPVVCLAGTDRAYAEWGEAATQALRDAGASYVVIAGRPVAYADDSCALGADALAFLSRVRKELR
ncbi:MAG: methylmalonyl-CoA mutase family protein [Nocardioides sp.]|uniref:methylmalonyl-CoA mutase family protein n=1 Tax=Nocardioides sp. TaxID=35761 RepID=UPI0039E3B7E4